MKNNNIDQEKIKKNAVYCRIFLKKPIFSRIQTAEGSGYRFLRTDEDLSRDTSNS